TLPVAAALARILASATYILAASSGIAAMGVCISTLTDSGPGATVATVILAIASQILDNIPSLHVIHPYLPTHGWLGFIELFRFPVAWGSMRGGLVVSAAYTILFLGLALWWFERRDVVS